MPRLPLVLTCEHASNAIPEDFASAFASEEASQALRSHEGWDLGAGQLCAGLLPLARTYHQGEWSRLLIDLNRSRRHPTLFSRFTKTLSREAKGELLRQIHEPYRSAVKSAVSDCLCEHGHALHVSVHTFTPSLGGVERACDIGLLYDPARPGEVDFVRELRIDLHSPALRLRRNYPYRGTADGLATTLRDELRHPGYIGIELEVNQRFFADEMQPSNGIPALLCEALQIRMGTARGRK